MFFLCSGCVTAGVCVMFIIPWLIPFKDDTEELAEIPSNDDLKDPESPLAPVDSMIFYDELAGNFNVVKSRLLQSELHRDSRHNSFILFSIVPQDSYRDLFQGMQRYENGGSNSALSAHEPSPLATNEAVGCDVRVVSSIDELCPSNGSGTPSCLVQNVERSAPDHRVTAPQLTTAQIHDTAINVPAVMINVEEVESFVSSCSESGGSSVEQDLEESGLSCTSCNSSDTNISLKSSSQDSVGTSDSGYIAGIMPSYPSGDLMEQNSESERISEDTMSVDIALVTDSLLSDKIPACSCESCESCGLSEECMEATMTRDAKTLNKMSTFDCSDMLADMVGPGPHQDYYSDLMESMLEEEFTCTCAEDEESTV